jgi:hypothetical protein
MFNLWGKKIEAVLRSVELLSVNQGDVIVLYSEQEVPKQTRDELYSSARKVLDMVGIKNEIILLTHGLKLLILRKTNNI